MLIRTMCRSCLGGGTRVDIFAHTDTSHPTTGDQALASHTCTDCDGTGYHLLAATTHPTPSDHTP